MICPDRNCGAREEVHPNGTVVFHNGAFGQIASSSGLFFFPSLEGFFSRVLDAAVEFA
jgi:uncharacterized protein YgiB involved in biofilm formation